MARTPQDPKIRINEILDATEHLFATKGYHGTTICDIAKKMGVAQGMFYYYFKSKEEILEALLNRHTSAIISEIKAMLCSNITPPQKIDLMVSILLHNARYNDGLLLDTLNDTQNLHIKDKLCRQFKHLLTPCLLKIIEEGVCTQNFHVLHPETTSDFILAIIELLIDALYEKMPADLLSLHLRMAEALIEKTLGAQEATIHISL